MSENENQTFLTALPDPKPVHSILINDEEEEEIDIDIKSSADSEDLPAVNDEIDEILNKNQSQAYSSVLAPHPTADALQDKMSHDDPSPSAVGEHLQTIIPRSVYEYAAIVHDKLGSPRQSKLGHDVNAVLGSSDPPPGFGFLHPRFYYLEQKRPVPMEPLRVWRGYNGHVYFAPIQVQQLDSDRAIPSAKPRKPTTIRTASFATKIPIRSSTNLSIYRNKKSANNKDQTNNEQFRANRKVYARTATNGNELKNNTLATFVEEEEENKAENRKMWQSVVTCIPVQMKPISKRNPHAIEDIQTFEQEQLAHDSNGQHRQVLPNIRPIPKSKFLHKGLAYKEVKKIPGVNKENDQTNPTDSLKKPLINYNLTQAYIRQEVNAERAEQMRRQSILPPTSSAKNQPLAKTQTSLDLREIRKRIVKGTTLPYRPIPQSASRIPGRTNNKSAITSENPCNRPSTSKSSIPLKQTTIIEMPILTKYVHRPRSISRQTPTSDFLGNGS